MNKWAEHSAIFLLSPMLALLNAIPHIRSMSTCNLIWLFCAFYGLAFYYDPNSGTDSVFYINSLKEMHQSDLTFESLKGMFYREGERYFDVFEPILTFLVSRFTDDPRIFFGVVGFVYGFFYSRIIHFAAIRLNLETSFREWCLLAILAFTVEVGTGINGVRFGVAQVVFLWGTVQYLESRRNLHLGMAALSILVHFSFLFPMALLLLERFASKLHFPVYLFFLGSFIAAEIDLAVIRNFIEMLPGLGSRVEGYITDREGEFREMTWLIEINRRLTQTFMIIGMSYFYLTSFSQRRYSHLGFCVFAMLLCGAVNMTGQVGSVYRFYVTSNAIAIYYVLLQVNWYRKEIPEVETMGLVAIVLLLVQFGLGLRFFLGFASTNLVASNPIIIWFMDGKQSLYDFVPRLW